MPAWKRILLKSIGMGIGVGVGLAPAVGLYAWYSSRPVPPKPWDSKAITATFVTADTTGDDSHLRFRYILENHTNQDYRVRTSDLYLSAVLQEQSTLTGSGNGAVKFDEDAIFLPTNDHEQVEIELPSYGYAGVKRPANTASDEEYEKYRDAVKKYVNENLPRLNGFAAFDEANRYRINFPNGWQVASESPSPKDAKSFTVSHAELARTKLFRGATEEGRISILQSTDSFYAAVDKSAQRLIVDRLWEETRNAPEFDLPDDALCAFDAAWVSRAFHGTMRSPCHYAVQMASCPTPTNATPPKGYTLEDDNKPCYTVRPTRARN